MPTQRMTDGGKTADRGKIADEGEMSANGGFEEGRAPTETLEVTILWGDERQLGLAEPAAIEIAGLMMGLEDTYEALAGAFGYPPHFLKVTSIHNPELTLSVEGGKDVIEAVRELLYAVPTLIANLFRPKAAWSRARIEDRVRTQELEARSAAAEADRLTAEAVAVEELGRKARAEMELAELYRVRAELQSIPIKADEAAHAVLNDVAAALKSAEPSRRLGFVADTARYSVIAHSFEAKGRTSVVPRSAKPSDTKTRQIDM
jgi:hypothetical protein